VLATLVWATVLLIVAAPDARAQGLFYKEIRKGDRIYVFNIAANAERFEKTGELPKGLTRPGAGPNGETVFADNERALQLFFFKHGISEQVPEPEPSPPPYRFSGLMFGDYYWFPKDHLDAWDGQHGLWFRRIYFTYDHTFSSKVVTRLRLEMNSNGDLEGGALTPYVKDAYLRWTFHGRQQLTLGIQPSLTFEQVEAVWELRHIEKTPLDLYRWDSSRDAGATVSGPINESATWKYGAQFGNESGNDSETDEFKAYRIGARYENTPGILVEGMLAQFERDRNADRTTAQIFAGYRAARARTGLLYTFQKRRAADDGSTSEVNLDLLSGFGVVDLKPQKISAFVRIDRHADPCPDCADIDYLPIDPSAAFTLTLAGIEYYIHPSVRFSPNVEWVAYGTPRAANGTHPTNDLVVRLTFFWVW
jgi:hypothetical protein